MTNTALPLHDVEIRYRPSIYELPACADQPLLAQRDTVPVPNSMLDDFDGITGTNDGDVIAMFSPHKEISMPGKQTQFITSIILSRQTPASSSVPQLANN